MESLEQRLARGSLSPEEIVRVASDIAIALQEIHRDGLAYGRLEPATIMLGPGGVKFDQRGSASGGKIRPYTAPEQVAGKPADSRSDIFALGAILYEMSTGHRCFEGKGPEAWKAAILTREPPPIAAGPGAPDAGALARALNLIIRDCLVKDPDRRRQRIHSVLLDLKLIALPSRRSERCVPRDSEPAAPSRDSEEPVPRPEIAAPDPPRAQAPAPDGTAAAVNPLFSAPEPELLRAEDTEDEDEEKPRKKRLSCPRCGWFDIRLSASRGVLDDILSMFLLVPYRCRTCSARFHRLRRRTPMSHLSPRAYGGSDPDDAPR